MEISDDYVDKLRAVFDLCDTKKQNFISVQHFIELAKEHFGAVEDGLEVCIKLVDYIKLKTGFGYNLKAFVS